METQDRVLMLSENLPGVVDVLEGDEGHARRGFQRLDPLVADQLFEPKLFFGEVVEQIA